MVCEKRDVPLTRQHAEQGSASEHFRDEDAVRKRRHVLSGVSKDFASLCVVHKTLHRLFCELGLDSEHGELSQKMSPDDARKQCPACGAGRIRRLADLDQLVQCRCEKKFESKVGRSRSDWLPFNARFTSSPRLMPGGSAQSKRCSEETNLILEGGSALGKTEYARAMTGAQNTQELHCASCGKKKDMRQWWEKKDRCILFYEAPPTMVLANRKLFCGPGRMGGPGAFAPGPQCPQGVPQRSCPGGVFERVERAVRAAAE